MTLCDIANYVLQDICGQQDMRFQFEGLQDEDDKQPLVNAASRGSRTACTPLTRSRVGWTCRRGVFRRRASRSCSRPRGRSRSPWPRSSSARDHREPAAIRAGNQLRAALPFVPVPDEPAERPPRRADQAQRLPPGTGRRPPGSPRHARPLRRRGSHPVADAAHRGHDSRSSVAGSRKKAVESELGALKRHLRKGRLISTWVAEHIPERALGMIAEDVAKGVLLDVAVERAGDICLSGNWTLLTLVMRQAGSGGFIDKADATGSPLRKSPALAGLGAGPRSRRRLQAPHRAGFP